MSGKRILIVDDDRSTRELMTLMLTHEGHDMLFAEDGKEAVEIAATEKPDVVLMDGLLPKLHGFLACKAIKEMADPPKVILVTGVYTKPTYKWEVRRLYQADDILFKPLDLTELASAIDRVVSGAAPQENDARDSQADQFVSAKFHEATEPTPCTAFAFRRFDPAEMISSLRLAVED
ncbi:MAG TPA: response regulator [Blastocatellia bacterium]|nr:response regulator [Blastocatellia bacterium]